MRETEHEEEMVRLGRDRERAKYQSLVQRGKTSLTRPGRSLIRQSVLSVAKGLDNWLEKRTKATKHAGGVKLLSVLPTKVSALIGCHVVLDVATRPSRYQTVAGKIGSALAEEYAMRRLKVEAPHLYTTIMREHARYGGARRGAIQTFYKKHPDIPYHTWASREVFAAGSIVLETIHLTTGIVYIDVFRESNKRAKITVTPSKALLDWLENSQERHEALFPSFMPTLIPPKPWETPESGGGYHSRLLARFPFVTRKTGMEEVPMDRLGNLEKHIKTANVLQATAWEVNEAVYQVAKHYWEHNVPFPGGVHRDPDPIPPRPDRPRDDPVVLAWRKFAAHTHRANERNRSRRFSIAYTFHLASKFAGKRIWFPYHCDFRGRLYPVPPYLQPQGDDLARGLLRFADAEPITQDSHVQWLAIHGANLWGHDKLVFSDRVDWVHKNEDNIRRVYQDPLAYTWWAEAEEPWQFLAFCLEYGGYLETGMGYQTHLPIAVDGSNNGLQIFSLLMRDPELAKSTNVSPSPTPQDVYSEIAAAASTVLRASSNPLAKVFVQEVGDIPRSAVKRVVMTLPYGLTQYSAFEYISDWYRTFIRDRGRPVWSYTDMYRGIYVLRRAIWSAIQRNIAAAHECMGWLRKCASLLGDNGLIWTTPVGMKVWQKYLSNRTSVIRTHVGTVSRTFRVITGREGVHTTKQRNGVAPNFVHSLDASALVMTVIRSMNRGVRNFQTIHDSFGTLAPHMDILAEELRTAYGDVFSLPLLENFRKENQERTGVELPPPPQLGDLDPQVVRDSPYFFA